MKMLVRMPAFSRALTWGPRRLPVGRDLQPALGRQLLGPLRHERDDVGPDLEGDGFFISSVAAISTLSLVLTASRRSRRSRSLMCRRSLADVADDAVGAGLFGQQGDEHGLGLGALRASRSVAKWSMLTASLMGSSELSSSPRCSADGVGDQHRAGIDEWPGRAPRP